MALKLTPDMPYSDKSPFDVLGVSRAATAHELRDAQEARLEAINHANHTDEERIRRRQEIKDAYTILRDAKKRIAVQIFYLNDDIGGKRCLDFVEKFKALQFDFNAIFQGMENMLSASPEVADVEKTFRPAPFQHSVVTTYASAEFQFSPRREALRGLQFPK